jgi:hypothetical protein
MFCLRLSHRWRWLCAVTIRISGKKKSARRGCICTSVHVHLCPALCGCGLLAQWSGPLSNSPNKPKAFRVSRQAAGVRVRVAWAVRPCPWGWGVAPFASSPGPGRKFSAAGCTQTTLQLALDWDMCPCTNLKETESTATFSSRLNPTVQLPPARLIWNVNFCVANKPDQQRGLHDNSALLRSLLPTKATTGKPDQQETVGRMRAAPCRRAHCPCLFQLFRASRHQKLLRTVKRSTFQSASIKFVWVKTIQNQHKHIISWVVAIVGICYFLNPESYGHLYLPSHVILMILRISTQSDSPHSQILRKAGRQKQDEPNRPIADSKDIRTSVTITVGPYLLTIYCKMCCKQCHIITTQISLFFKKIMHNHVTWYGIDSWIVFSSPWPFSLISLFMRVFICIFTLSRHKLVCSCVCFHVQKGARDVLPCPLVLPCTSSLFLPWWSLVLRRWDLRCWMIA